MMKDVFRDLDAGIWPIIGLLAFLVAFLLILARVLLMKKSEREEAKQIPLDDATEITPKHMNDHDERHT